MKTKILIPTLSILMLLFLITGCGGGGKYADVIALNKQYVKLMETYIADLDKADSATKVSDAMNRYADGLEKIWPQMMEMGEKYPELQNPNNLPDELRPAQEEAESLAQKMMGTFQKIMPYMEDPEVVKAQQRLSAIMQG